MFCHTHVAFSLLSHLANRSARQLSDIHISINTAPHCFLHIHNLMMADFNNRVYPPRTSSRFAPGVYFNFEWGVALNGSERPTHIRGVNYTSRRMQERFTREEAQRQQRSQQQVRHQLPPIPTHPTIETPDFEQDVNWEYREFQQERQRRHGISTREQHSRGSSAPPSFERDEILSPVSPISPEHSIRPQRHAATFPRETLDRPLPYSPAHFRLGEDELPWSTPLWYRPSESENPSPVLTRTSPALRSARRHSASQASIKSQSSSQSQSRLSLMGGLPSLGYESIPGRPSHQQRRSPRRQSNRVAAPVVSHRQEDPQRVQELAALHSAMMGVDSLDLENNNDGWESWAPNNRGRNETAVITHDEQPPIPTFRESRSLGWAVRTEADLSTASGGEAFQPSNRRVLDNSNDFVGFYGRDMISNDYNDNNQQFETANHRQSQVISPMSPPPPYLESQWEMLGRRMARPRSSDDRMGMTRGITYWG